MMLRLLPFLLALSFTANAQKTRLYGTVKDASSGEPLIAANVLVADGLGVVTDLDGKYSIDVANGDYTLTVSYIGYEAQTKAISLKGGQLELHFALKTFTLNEVKVVADMALDRKTPVAFTNIDPVKIKQELGGQDLPLLLNSTPGVYATNQGGGAGDARVTIRGFDQRNISVQIDGVPMNDMENGWVYWSNWAGIEGVTQRVQVQRGLGASKLSIPAVGGSMNILTTGITSKRSTEISLTVGNNGLIRTNIGFNSGRLAKGWGVTAAFAFDRQDGWVEATWATRAFYFIKLQKELGNHSLSFSAMGAPQERGRRLNPQPIFMYDRAYAQELGVDLTHPSVTSNPLPGNYGPRYNQQWGTVIRRRNDPNAMAELQSVDENFYHKPVLNLRHFWNKDKWAVSNIVYASFGNGGGTQLRGNTAAFDQYGHFDLTSLYNENITGTAFVPPYDLSAVNDTSQYKARNFILANMHNHYWYGLLTTIDHRISDTWKLAMGIDFRSYWVERYSTPYDLLGGDYTVINATSAQTGLFNRDDKVKRPGDVAGYRTNSNAYNAGIFGQVEYAKDKFSGFVSVSVGNNSYIRYDRMRKRDLVLPDTIIREALGIRDTITYNGQKYTHESPEARYATSEWVNFWGGTAKMGVNYNINDHMNVFVNGGVFLRPPTISDLYVSSNSFNILDNIKTEMFWGVELGYSVKYPRWAANLNLYRTTWENRPLKTSVQIGGVQTTVALPNLGSVHQGIEFDAVYKTPWYFDIEGLVSYGDWRWKGDVLALYYVDGVDTAIGSINVAANGVHLGDAAQFQVAGSINIKPIEGVYIKGQITYFDNNYSQFNPLDLRGDNRNRDSWQLPSYYLLDIHAGWTIKLKKMDVSLRASVLNVLDAMFISDAQNNAASGIQNFDAASAHVFMGMGRRWTATVGIKF